MTDTEQTAVSAAAFSASLRRFPLETAGRDDFETVCLAVRALVTTGLRYPVAFADWLGENDWTGAETPAEVARLWDESPEYED